MKIREPSIAKAFELKTMMDTGLTLRPDDLTLEQYDLLGVIKEEENRLQMRRQKEAEAGARRMNQR